MVMKRAAGMRALWLLALLPACAAAASDEPESTPPLGDAKVELKAYQQEMLAGYVEQLKSYPRFDSTGDVGDLRSWGYASPDDPSLVKMNEQYGLKGIAGEGAERSRFLRLLDWAHRVTRGTGDIGTPDALNTPTIVEFVRSTGQAVNCRMKAIVLQEALLALGYRSRRISLQPAREDGDTHSIVTVYSRDQGRWICLDPTFDTYFHDDHGAPLGYLEIRHAYESGRVPRFRSITIPLQGSLGLAGQAFDSYDSWYAVYIAKNCFKASCPQRSAFGYESSDALARVALVPGGYGFDPGDGGDTTYTTDADYFFRAP
jgi:hypothetical protein